LALLDAAEGLQAAALAGFGIVAWVDFGSAGEEVAGELLDGVAPVDQVFSGKGVLYQSGRFAEAGSKTRPAND
jgi:hypothetical protein